VWTRWEPGGEYTKTLSVKNVSGRAVTVVHRLNASKAFALDFPAPVRLSPGMCTPLRVVFRPLRRQAYSDSLDLSCDGVPVSVPLSAPLPASRLDAPGGVDFGLVPARERAAAQLPIANTGAAPLAFSWRVEPPFSVAPPAGRLAPGEGLACEVAFEPLEAAAFSGSAVCELDSGEAAVVQVGGRHGWFGFGCAGAQRLAATFDATSSPVGMTLDRLAGPHPQPPPQNPTNHQLPSAALPAACPHVPHRAKQTRSCPARPSCRI
jgi:hypothetical protein